MACNDARGECPVCLESFEAEGGARTKLYAFGCGHALCQSCDQRMIDRDAHRCPLCRAPRIGMSEAEVQPRAEEGAGVVWRVLYGNQPEEEELQSLFDVMAPPLRMLVQRTTHSAPPASDATPTPSQPSARAPRAAHPVQLPPTMLNAMLDLPSVSTEQWNGVRAAWVLEMRRD